MASRTRKADASGGKEASGARSESKTPGRKSSHPSATRLRASATRLRAGKADDGPSRADGTTKADGAKAAAQALQESEERFRLVFDASALGIAIVDPEGRPVRCNPALERLLGYSEAELVTMTFPAFTHPNDVELDWSLYTELVEGKRNHYQIEKRYIRKDGGVVWGRLTVSLLPGQRPGSPLGIGMVEDITERRALQDQLHQAQRMEAVGRLARGVAHDFNNLLTVIAANCHMLSAELDPSDVRTELVADIREAADRAGGLTRQLMAFSRKTKLEPTVIEPTALVERVAKALQRLIGDGNKLELVLDPTAGHVRADAGQLEQVLMNLVMNARDAMPSGGTLTLGVRSIRLGESETPADAPFVSPVGKVEPGSYVVMSVADTGRGMDRETMTRIFEPFFTTKSPDDGSGLGLSVAFGIVRQSDGHIDVASQPGQGTTFRVFLPRIDASR